MSSLPVLKVRTNHSEYLIDQNAGRFCRKTVSENANPIEGYSGGEWHDYQKVYSGLEAGEPLIIVKLDGSWVRSTIVQDIEEVEAAA